MHPMCSTLWKTDHQAPLRRTGFALIAALLLTAAPVLAAAAPQANGQGAAQTPEQTPPVAVVVEARNSPKATLRTFVAAMAPDPTAPPPEALACMDASGVAGEQVNQLATYLSRIIDRIEKIDFENDSIPDANDLEKDPVAEWTFFPRPLARRDRARRERADEILQLAPDARVVLARQPNGEWKFSQATVAALESLHAKIQSSLRRVKGIEGEERLLLHERIEALFPETFISNDVLAIKYWQWIALGVVALLGVVLDLLLRLLLTNVTVRIIRRKGAEAQRASLRKMVRPFGLAATAMLWLWALGKLGLPGEAVKVLSVAVRLFAMLAVVWAAFRLIDVIGEVLASKAARTHSKIDDLLVPLVRKTAKVIVTAIGLIYIADSMQIEILPLLTGLGIGTLAFGLAAKDSIENFFGSVAVIADRPFEVGDWVQIGDVEGTVEELGFRSTRIRTFYNSLVTVPNATLVRAVVDNYGRRKYRRWKTHLNLTYDTPPDKIEAFCEGLRELLRNHPYTRKDYYQIWLHEFGAHSLDVLVYIFFEAPEWSTELRERHRLMLDILRLADRLGVNFAFPTQTLHMFSEEQDTEHTPAEAPDEHARRRAFLEARRAVRDLTERAEWRKFTPEPYKFDRAEDTAPGGDAAPSDGDDDETQIESRVGGDG